MARPHAPRRARSRQHPDADVGRRPDLAGAARQVGDGGAARVAAAAAAAQRARPRGVGTPTHGGRLLSVRERMEAASREPGVQLVPPRDRSARPRARELRRHRPLPHQGQWPAGRRGGRAVRRHARSTVPADCATCCSSAGTTVLRTFTENLMTYALGRRVEPLRHADACAAIVRDGRGSATTGSRPSSWAWSTSPAFQHAAAERARDAPPRACRVVPSTGSGAARRTRCS